MFAFAQDLQMKTLLLSLTSQKNNTISIFKNIYNQIKKKEHIAEDRMKIK